MAKKSNKRKSVQAAKTPEPSRRDILKLARNGVIGAAVIGSGGYFAVESFLAYAAEHDLSRVGQGNPVIVQIHDPQCPICTTLQKQVRKALKSIDDCGLTYLVADISTQSGAAFAARFGVPHVTLLMLDGLGARVHTVSGPHSAAELGPIFADYKAALA